MATTAEIAAPPRESYGRLFLRFLRFGVLGWGDSVALIAMIYRELADEEHWVSHERLTGHGRHTARPCGALGASIRSSCIRERISHARYTDTRAPNRPAAAHQ